MKSFLNGSGSTSYSIISGANGPIGPMGPTGPQGIQGIQGNKGVTGPTGPTGQIGSIGPMGNTGAQGIQGIKGDTGANGINKTIITAGTPVPNYYNFTSLSVGKSSFINVDCILYISGYGYFSVTDVYSDSLIGIYNLGYPGNAQSPTQFATLSEIIVSGMIGPTGNNGMDGVNGIDGINGDTGLKGDTGAQGIIGPTGPSVLTNCSDVNISTPLNNNYLSYDSNNSKWVNHDNYFYSSVQQDTNINPVNIIYGIKYIGSGNTYILPSGINGKRILICTINGGTSQITVPNGVGFCGVSNCTIYMYPYTSVEVEYQSTQFILISASGTLFSSTNITIYPPLIERMLNVSISSPNTNYFLRLNGYANPLGQYSYIGSVVNIADISGISISTPTTNQILKYNGTTWINSNDTDITTLSELTDINITSPVNGEILSYNSTSTKWENISPSRCLPTAEIYIGGGLASSFTETLTTQNQWYLFNSATSLVTNPSGASIFSSTSNCSITYNGVSGKYYHTAVSVSTSTNRANDNYQLCIHRNSNVELGTVFSIDFANPNVITSTAFHKVMQLNNGDVFDIRMRNLTVGGAIITYNNINFVLMACCN